MLEIHASRTERRQILAELWQHAMIGQQLQRIAAGHHEIPAERPSRLRPLLEQAAESLRRHARSHPCRADTHYHLAVCHDLLDHREDAEKSLTAALKLNPRYGDAQRLGEAIGQTKIAA